MGPLSKVWLPKQVSAGGRSSGVQLGRDRVEQTRQAAAEGGSGGDDADSDKSGDQAIFNGGRAGLVVSETSNSVHFWLLAHVILVIASFDASAPFDTSHIEHG